MVFTFVCKKFSSCRQKISGKNCRQIYIFFRTAVLRKLFDIRISYKHCNFSRACLLAKMASKTVTSSILPHSRGRMFSRGWFVHRQDQNWNRHRSSLRKHSQPTFRNITINFPAKLRLTNERWNSILMTRHYPDLGCASDWSCREGNLLQPVRSTTQIWVGVISMESLRSFLRRFYAGKPLLASWKVGCFLKRNRRQKARY